LESQGKERKNTKFAVPDRLQGNQFPYEFAVLEEFHSDSKGRNVTLYAFRGQNLDDGEASGGISKANSRNNK
jgi:hypothetical protein